MFWIAALVGAGSGALLLALVMRLQPKTAADYGFLVFAIMLSIYFGARLVTGSLAEIAIEFVIANIAIAAARSWMLRWPPAIGVMIFFHGIYDAVFGPHTGVAEWYPPLCAGFDLVVGIGLLVILSRKLSNTSGDPA